ncbi:TlpA family protein disulfide reductase [Planktosalinus lacus]|uniref:Peroxiredoxin-like protein n=1 Tax=Planktosalinus lacus TaxID=1526573 RepID=A0A8J2V8D6_9FLAO|nr:TlpA disulfide reductase family protein [Planktosalinus lacus]GGD87660.1 peroxiredoxin-like protein [Planktosalinus lacus]
MKALLTFFISILFLQSFSQTELPDMTLKNIDGTDVNIQNISQDDQVVIISLWATWCVPCKNELDAISVVYDDWKSETNVVLYAISVDDARTVRRVRPMINGKSWDYEFLLDTNNDLKRALGAATVPLTLVVKNNKILYRHSGYTPGAEDELYEKVVEFSK